FPPLPSPESYNRFHPPPPVREPFKNVHISFLRHHNPEPPQVMMLCLLVVRSCRRNHDISPWIKCLSQPLDGTALSSGVPPFESEDHRNSSAVQLPMKFCQFFLKLFLFLLIFFSCVGQRQISFIQYRLYRLFI